MKLEQHIYTSGKSEFTTVAMTDGITQDEQMRLENASIYFLPISLHYQEGVVSPVKYIWYPLGDERFVVGRAVYTGKDGLGRTGNYLFHNLVLSKANLIACCQINPVRLIHALNAQQIFQERVPEQPLQALDVLPDDHSVLEARPALPPRDILAQILAISLSRQPSQQPLLLLGNAQECLDFLQWLYTVLPYDARTTLAVDTYAYGVSSLGFQIIGSPDGHEYQQGLTSALTLHLGRQEHTVFTPVAQDSPYLTYIGDLIHTQRHAELQVFYRLEYALHTQRYEIFKQEYPQAPADVQVRLWEFYHARILEYIASASDVELLRLVQTRLSVADLDALALAPELIARLIEIEEPDILRMIAAWLCASDNSSASHSYLLASLPLWKAFLEYVQTHPRQVSALLEPTCALARSYSPEFERELLDALLYLLPVLTGVKDDTLFQEVLAHLPAITSEQKSAKAFLNALNAFPPPPTEELVTLRRFVKYELSKDFSQIEHLLARPLTHLSPQHQTLVFTAIVSRLLVIRSLELWDPQKTGQALQRLFDNVGDDWAALSRLLTALKNVKLGGKARKLLKPLFDELQPRLPEGAEGAALRQQMQSIVKSGSILDAVTGLFKIRL